MHIQHILATQASLDGGEHGSGSWCTCQLGSNRDPPSDVCHVQFQARIGFKLVCLHVKLAVYFFTCTSCMKTSMHLQHVILRIHAIMYIYLCIFMQSCTYIYTYTCVCALYALLCRGHAVSDDSGAVPVHAAPCGQPRRMLPCVCALLFRTGLQRNDTTDHTHERTRERRCGTRAVWRSSRRKDIHKLQLLKTHGTMCVRCSSLHRTLFHDSTRYIVSHDMYY